MISPRNPDEVVVAGATGVWRSIDAGDSWAGLNEGLPNLPAARILLTGTDDSVHILSGGSELAWNQGERFAWRATSNSMQAKESQLKSAASATLGVQVTSIAAGGELLYAGSAEGGFFVSRDSGSTWAASGVVAGAGGVNRIAADPKDAMSAVASTQSGSRARVLRTTTGGVFWEDLTGNLPAGAAVRGVAFDRASNAIYAATDRGLYFAYAESSAVNWSLLRAGSLTDVALDSTANQVYVAAEESGIFAALSAT